MFSTALSTDAKGLLEEKPANNCGLITYSPQGKRKLREQNYDTLFTQ